MKQCRFCLEDTDTVKNPLIEPCVCRGSVQFVHLLCLRRWALLEPDENAYNCSICKEPFQINVLPRYETVPPRSLSMLIVDRTALVGLAIHYSVIVFSSNLTTNVHTLMSQIKGAQGLFHFIWVWALLHNHRVANPELYREKMVRGLIPLIIATHLFMLVRLFFYNEALYCFMINTIMNFYWKEHIRLIGLVNQELTMDV